MSNIERLKLRVQLVSTGDEVHEIAPLNASLVAWDRTRTKQAPVWPSSTEAPHLWMTFIAWHHLRFALKLVDCTFEVFEKSECAAVESFNDEAAEAVDPTQPEAERDSPSS